MKSRKDKARMYRDEGIKYMEDDQFDLAMEAHQKAKGIHEELKDWGGVAGDITNIALVFEKKGDVKYALALHEEALQLDLQVGFKRGLLIDYENLTRLYSDIGEIERALVFHQKLIDLYMEMGYKVASSELYRERGFILSELARYDDAIAAHEMAKKLNLDLGNMGGMAGDITNIAIIYEEKGNITEAIKLHYEALKIDEEINFKPGLKIDYANLIRINTDSGNYAKVNEYMNKYNALIFELEKSKLSKKFHIIPKGAKATIRIIKQNQNVYKVGYSLPSTIRMENQYSQTKIDDERLKSIANKIEEITDSINEMRKIRGMNNFHESQAKASNVLNEMKALGNAIYVITLPSRIKQDYLNLNGIEAIELGLTEDVIQYPWELMHDGDSFFGLKHSIGRYIISETKEVPFINYKPKEKLRILIIGDLSSENKPPFPPPFNEVPSLPGAKEEALSLEKALAKIEGVETTLLIGGDIDSIKLINELSKEYDIIHYSGLHQHIINTRLQRCFLQNVSNREG
jgi:tetratricopeptide (TPR) repeat protein